jgi:hypothetical protein
MQAVLNRQYFPWPVDLARRRICPLIHATKWTARDEQHHQVSMAASRTGAADLTAPILPILVRLSLPKHDADERHRSQ